MALPSPTSQPAYPHQQGPLIPSSVFSSDRDLQELVNRRDMRISSTHDLAEFLRSSRPEDYTRSAKTSDDLALEGSHKKISFKFLKTASKDFLSPRKTMIPVPVPSTVALPEKVRSKKTSKGNSYLAIQVDYTPGRSETFVPSIWTPSPSDDGNRHSITNTTSVEFSSDRSNYRNSLVSQTWKEQDSTFQPEYDSFTTSGTRGMSRWLRSSSGSEISSSRVALVPSSAPFSPIKSEHLGLTSFSNKYAHVQGAENALNTISALTKNSSSPSTAQRRYSSDSTPRATPFPCRNTRFCSSIQQNSIYIPLSSPISSTLESESPNSIKSQSKDPYMCLPNRPALPGPPPSRELPSLPEGHGDAINLASKIRAAAAARSSIGSQMSLASDIGSLKSRRAGVPSRARSEREISVKARRLKDLEESRNRRSISQSDDSHLLPTPVPTKSKKTQGRPKKRQLKTEILTFSPITIVYEVAPDDEYALESQSEHPIPTCALEPEARQSVSSAASSEALPPEDRQSVDLPTQCSSSAETGVISSSALVDVSSSANLEVRIKNMERRNHLLEQALLAVLRGAICMDTGNGVEGPGLSEIVKCLANIPAPAHAS
ncbi:hypothetical protein H072_9488 [Dactylellina haptotyla CBS 200.50]|uniref:Uncharacterized protein n=1 Tax=Dactylellina haptotyla (strain CBS 200.50) TaxID=1284197 RepID=S8A1T6_DACHA|nr:hypothetical protein H072_9488 [Dactylellina haptotyla CBS 200.50]